MSPTIIWEKAHEKSFVPFLSEGETDNEEPAETLVDFAVGASLQARVTDQYGARLNGSSHCLARKDILGTKLPKGVLTDT